MADKPRLSDLFAHWQKHRYPSLRERTQHEYLRIWSKYIVPFFGDPIAEEIKNAQARLFYESFGDKKCQANRSMAVFKAVFNFGIKYELVPEKKFHVEKTNEEARQRFPSKDEAGRLFKALETYPEIFQKYIYALTLTGCRPGEILNSEWSWIEDLGLKLPISKTRRKGEHVTLSNAARELINSIPKESNFIFKGNTLKSLWHVNRLWRRLMNDAGISGLQTRDCRRWFASNLLSAGVSLDAVGRLLRHKSTSTTLRYSYLSTDVKDKNVELAAKIMDDIRKKT